MRLICVALLLLGSDIAAAEEARLKPVACDLEQVAFPPLIAQGAMKEKPGKDAGTTSPKAKVGNVVVQGNADILIVAAMDYTDPDAENPDVLRLDFTGKGKFDPNCAVALEEVNLDKRVAFQVMFGPEVINVQRDGATVPVAVRGMCMRAGEQSMVVLSFATAVEGKCTFADKEYPVRFIDATGDFRFDAAGVADPKSPMGIGTSPIDSVMIDVGDGTFTDVVIRAYYGQPVFVDGVWYDLTISADQSTASAKAIDLKSGEIEIDHDRWEMVLTKDGKVMCITGERSPVPLPAGDYKLVCYRQWSPPNAEGKRAWLAAMRTGPGAAASPTITITPGKVVKRVMGSPLQSKLGAEVKPDRTVEFKVDATQTSGGLPVVFVTRPGGWIVDRPDPPSVTVLDDAGESVDTFELEYG